MSHSCGRRPIPARSSLIPVADDDPLRSTTFSEASSTCCTNGFGPAAGSGRAPLGSPVTVYAARAAVRRCRSVFGRGATARTISTDREPDRRRSATQSRAGLSAGTDDRRRRGCRRGSSTAGPVTTAAGSTTRVAPDHLEVPERTVTATSTSPPTSSGTKATTSSRDDSEAVVEAKAAARPAPSSTVRTVPCPAPAIEVSGARSNSSVRSAIASTRLPDAGDLGDDRREVRRARGVAPVAEHHEGLGVRLDGCRGRDGVVQGRVAGRGDRRHGGR